MRVTKGSTALKFVTITPEREEEIKSRLLNYRICIGILRKMFYDGKISESTFKRGMKETSKNLGFDKNSIFYEDH